MPLSSEAQSLFDHAWQSLPRWLTGAVVSAKEWLYAFTEIFDEIRAQGQDWKDITYLDNATGAELDQHAYDRGTSRRAGESDGTLRERLRQISDAVTQPALIRGVDAILDGAGLLARLDVSSHTTTGWNTVFEVYDSLSAGGWQTSASLTMVEDGTHPPTVEESEGQVTVHFDAGVTTRDDVEVLILNDCSTFNVYSYSASPSSVLQAGDAFTANFVLSGFVNLRRDGAHMHVVGSSTAFMSRGYRMRSAARPMGYVFILPYPTNAPTANAIAEYLRQHGPGGYVYYVERRLTP
jgi:hypothetical protein